MDLSFDHPLYKSGNVIVKRVEEYLMINSRMDGFQSGSRTLSRRGRKSSNISLGDG